jgi:hypothetical protein
MKLTNSTIKNLIKEELSKLPKQSPDVLTEKTNARELRKQMKAHKAIFRDATSDDASRKTARRTYGKLKKQLLKITGGRTGRAFTREQHQLRRAINKLEKEGKITKDEWRQARKSLYRGTLNAKEALQKGGYAGPEAMPQGEKEVAAAKEKGMKLKPETKPGGPAAPAAPAGDPKAAQTAALGLYKAMKGMGTDEDAINSILTDTLNKNNAQAVYDAYNSLLKVKQDTDDGDLMQWLLDDGMTPWAQKLKQVLGTAAAAPAKEEAPKTPEKEEEPGGPVGKGGLSVSSLGLTPTAQQLAPGAFKKPAFQESTTYSSFSEHQKLFENWNRYLESTEEG